jgi:acyl-CoA synthetase (NDP forming)
MSSLDALFAPKSVAVIGASTKRGSIGREILHNIIEYEFNGKLFPVNPHAEFIHSIKCYPSVLDIPDEVEMAIIVVPASSKSYANAARGRRLVVTARRFRKQVPGGCRPRAGAGANRPRARMRLIGPNCMGVFSTQPNVRLNATFAPTLPIEGDIAFMSQSGAMGVAILNASARLNIGFSFFASVGNKADVSCNDLLTYWEGDERTRVVGLYLESAIPVVHAPREAHFAPSRSSP